MLRPPEIGGTRYRRSRKRGSDRPASPTGLAVTRDNGPIGVMVRTAPMLSGEKTRGPWQQGQPRRLGGWFGGEGHKPSPSRRLVLVAARVTRLGAALGSGKRVKLLTEHAADVLEARRRLRRR